ncbi:MAG TPA: DUF433 domain-containing protein [Vicinamibacteria bacterium]|nr:DUF433 domain-containing protein [Vicinamibacteria bacterium]
MSDKTRGIRLQSDLESEIRREAEERGKSWSAMTKELLAEAVRMRRVPGVVFADGPSGRRAVLAGTGIDVWEVIAAWKGGGQDSGKLREDFSWLRETQLRVALAYYELYPEEIDVRLERERSWTPERLRKELPFTTSLKG